MEQKKKNEKDVLVVRDEKTGEISVVAGLDSKGYPKTAPAKAEHSQDFLRFDRHGDMVDNFFRNFYRQCKEPTRFGFYRVAVDMADAVLPVIKDLLKDPAAKRGNARGAQGGHFGIPEAGGNGECKTRKRQ